MKLQWQDDEHEEVIRDGIAGLAVKKRHGCIDLDFEDRSKIELLLTLVGTVNGGRVRFENFTAEAETLFFGTFDVQAMWIVHGERLGDYLERARQAYRCRLNFTWNGTRFPEGNDYVGWNRIPTSGGKEWTRPSKPIYESAEKRFPGGFAALWRSHEA